MIVPSIETITVRKGFSTWHHTLDPRMRSYKTRLAAATAMVQFAEEILARAKAEFDLAKANPCDSDDAILTAFDDVAIPSDCPVSGLPPEYRSPAAAFASRGGRSKSQAKQNAARANGKKGGRPRLSQP